MLAGREHRLLADNAFALHLLLPARGIGDDPVPGPELHRLLAGVGDDDGIGPEIARIFRRRPLRHEVRLHGDLDLAGDGTIHGAIIIAKSLPGTNRQLTPPAPHRRSFSFQRSSKPSGATWATR